MVSVESILEPSNKFQQRVQECGSAAIRKPYGPPISQLLTSANRPPTPRPPHPCRGVSLGGRSSKSSGLHKGRDLLGRDGGKGLLGPGGDPSSQRRKTPFLPPKKRVDFKSPKLHSQHWNGSDDNSSKWTAKQPLDPVRETPDPSPASSTKTGLGSHVTTALSSPPHLESSDVDVSMTQRNDQGDVLGLGGYIEKKRLLSKTSLADVEEEVKVTRKMTRLGWGQGLAKYERQLKELNGQKPVPDGDNGETGNEAIVYTATASASSDRPSPTPGSNVDPGNNNANTIEMMVSKVAVPESSRGCSLPIGGIGYRGNSSTSLPETVIRPTELSDFSRKHCPPPDVGGNCNPCNSSLNMTETVTCAATVPSSWHGSSPSPGDIDDHGNIKSLAETVIFPEVSTFCRNPLPGGNSDPCNSSTSMTETVVSELASSHGCDPPPVAGDSGSLGKRSMRLTEILISPAVSALSPRFSTSPPPAGGGTSDLSNSSMSMVEGTACPASDGCSHPTGANGVHGHDSMNLLTEKVVRPEDMPPPPSHGCARSPAAGDNGALGNSNTSLTAALINADTALASCDGCNLPPDSSNAKSTKVQDIPHKLILQPRNKIQQSARMPAIILRKLRTPRTFLKKNNLFEEPQASELRGSRFKAWSQEEKDVFSEKLATFGTDFTKISSFLPQKTPADCSEYYSKDYKSECSMKGNKRLPTSQEQCNNVNDAAPYTSGIATVTATKNYRRMKTMAEHMKKPANHESVAHLQSHSLTDKGHHVESSIVVNEHLTGNVLVGEMNVPSLLGMNSPITNSDQAVSLTSPKTEAAELKNLNEDSCSNEEIRKGEQEIWTNRERCRLNQAIVNHGLDFASISVHVGTKSIEQCRNFLGNCKNGLNLGDKHVNNNVNSTISTNDKSVSNMDSATCVVQSYSMVKENVSQLTSAYHGDAQNYLAAGASGQGASERITSLSGSCQKIPNVTIESNQIISREENLELCTVPEECNDTAEHSQNDTETNSDIIDDSIAPSEMESLRSDSTPCIATDGAEISGHHEFVQPPEDSDAFKIGSKENNDRAKKDEKNPDHGIASKEDSDIQLGCIVNSQKEEENLGTISSLVGNDLSASPTQDSDGASKNIDMPPSTAPATLQAVYAKFYRGEVVDLNIPPDVAPEDVVSLALDNNRAEPSMDPSELLKTTEATAIIRARETTDLNGDSEPANHVNHVQDTHQSQTTIPETSHRPANQSGCIMLFGQVIYKAPYSVTSFTCSQGNQTVLCSSDMPSDTVVPIRAGGGKLYFSGPNVWRSTPIYPGQQAVLSNTTMPYGSTNGAAAWLRQQPGSSAFVNRSQPVNPGQQAVLSNTTLPYGSTNVAAAWPQLRLGSNALVNMSHPVNPRQQAVSPNTRMPHRSTNGALAWLQLQPGSSALVNMNQHGNPGHEAVLPNATMPQGLTNGTAAWLQLQPGSSAAVNTRQQRRHVHMTSYSTTRAGVPYHLRQDSSSSGGGGLINFNNFNPGQQQGPSRILDTSSVVNGYPCFPVSIQNQAPPTSIMRSGTNNIEGASTSNTGVAAGEKRRGRVRQNS
ncbi:unnamed protein product [Urochloa decumbens]|uniref:SANT domain-containing protein n=1 Tax=Urochloa decumbens TaxID=240449 RepID=A0ABC9DBH2_9POAL